MIERTSGRRTPLESTRRFALRHFHLWNPQSGAVQSLVCRDPRPRPAIRLPLLWKSLSGPRRGGVPRFPAERRNRSLEAGGLAAAVLLVAIAGGAPVVADQPATKADLVVVHARIWTGDPDHPEATALAAAGERLIAVGSDADVRGLVAPGTRVLDAGGKRMLPGFIDAHTHFVKGGFALLAPDLRSAGSRDEFVSRLAAYAAKLPAGRWIVDGRWDHENWPGSPLPTRQWIDAASAGHPVLIQRIDGHMALANTLALERAGITRDTPDPDGGLIVHDADGEPTGIVKDAAVELVARAVPPRSDEEIRDALDAAMAHAASLGITSIQDITLWEEWPVMVEAHRAGRLTVRIASRTPLATWERQRDLVAWGGRGDDWLRLDGVKAYADGSLGSATALFFEPYADQPSTSGLLADDFFPPGTYDRRVLAADRAGLQVSTHAIGEKANALVLDAYERVEREDGPRDRRFRIEHAQHLRPQDVPRFARLGVVASMQPVHLADDGRWAEKRLGPERVRHSYVFRSLLDSGAHVAFGTDWPVAPLDPMLGVAAAVTRNTLDGKHPEGWLPEQKMSLVEALRAYTAGAAWAGFAEHEKGILAPGYLADFVVLSDDPFAVAPERLSGIRAELTVVGGHVVFDRTAAAAAADVADPPSPAPMQ
jgi:predicted amidohydrolase YtcJ